jgi:hypothetical protein
MASLSIWLASISMAIAIICIIVVIITDMKLQRLKAANIKKYGKLTFKNAEK